MFQAGSMGTASWMGVLTMIWDSDCSENPAHCLPAGTEGILKQRFHSLLTSLPALGGPGFSWYLAL